mgnify:CR=1 FL=1
MIMKLIKRLAAAFVRQAEREVMLRASALNAQKREERHER